MNKLGAFTLNLMIVAVTLVGFYYWIISFGKYPASNIHLFISVFHIIFFVGVLLFCVIKIEKTKELSTKDYLLVLASIGGISLFTYSSFLIINMKVSYSNVVAIYKDKFCIVFDKSCNVSKSANSSLEYSCSGEAAHFHLKPGTFDPKFTPSTSTEFRSVFLKTKSHTTIQYEIGANELLVNVVPSKSQAVIPFSNCKGLTTEYDRVITLTN